MCEVGEDVLKMSAQRLSDVHVGLGGELSLQLGGHVGHQTQFVVQFIVAAAVAQVFVDG